MHTIITTHTAQVEFKKSIFIATICPFSAFKNELQTLKDRHPKASHFVYALRYFNPLKQIIEDKSDDGEPKGTSALPCLAVLRGSELINVSLIVVRYFGGVKLGTGGLVRAYTAASNAALKVALFCPIKERLILHTSFQILSQIEHFLQKNALTYSKNFQADKIILNIDCDPKERLKLEQFCKDFNPQHLSLEC